MIQVIWLNLLLKPIRDIHMTFLKVNFWDNIIKKTHSSLLTTFSFSSVIPYWLWSTIGKHMDFDKYYDNRSNFLAIQKPSECRGMTLFYIASTYCHRKYHDSIFFDNWYFLWSINWYNWNVITWEWPGIINSTHYQPNLGWPWRVITHR